MPMEHPVMKPCPFCGSVDIHACRTQRQVGLNDITNYWYIVCTDCSCQTGYYLEYPHDKTSNNVSDIISVEQSISVAVRKAESAWNNRVKYTKATISSDEYIEACKAVEGMAVDKLLDVLKKCGVNVDGK